METDEYVVQRHPFFRSAPGKTLEECEPYQFFGITIHEKKTQKELGYICASYIKSEDWKKYEEDPFKYLTRFRGQYYYDYAKMKDLIWVPDPHKMLDFAYGNQLLDLTYEEYQDLKHTPRDELLDRVPGWIEKAKKEKGFKKEIKRMQEATVDSPFIDYISVEPEHQNKGIGQKLYGELATWVQEKGLILHSSRIQSPEAEKVWASMVKKGWAVEQILKHASNGGQNKRYQLVNHPLLSKPVNNEQNLLSKKRLTAP